MPLDIQCDKCSRKFRAPEKLAGKKIKCPSCQNVLQVPEAPDGPPPPKTDEARPTAKARAGTQSKAPAVQKTSGAGKTAKKTPVAKPLKPEEPAEWRMMTEDGEQFGPVTRSELDDWATEGRLDATCQVLQDGWDQWKWADEVYPELAEAATEAAAEPENPFAGIGEGPAAAAIVNPYASPQATGVSAGGAAGADAAGVTLRARRALAETRPWVMFLGILGLVVNGLAALVGLALFFLFALAAGGAGVAMGLMTLVSPGLGLVASYFLLTYGLRIGNFLRSGAGREFEEAMIAQKSFWKLAGIVALVILALYLTIFLMLFALGGLASLLPPVAPKR